MSTHIHWKLNWLTSLSQLKLLCKSGGWARLDSDQKHQQFVLRSEAGNNKTFS